MLENDAQKGPGMSLMEVQYFLQRTRTTMAPARNTSTRWTSRKDNNWGASMMAITFDAEFDMSTLDIANRVTEVQIKSNERGDRISDENQ